MHVKHVSDVTYHLSNRCVKCHKTSAKINNVKNVNIFLFVYSLSLTVLKLCSWAR